MIPSTGRCVTNEEKRAITVALVAITSLRLSLAVASITEEWTRFPKNVLKCAIQSLMPMESSKTARVTG